MAHSLMTQGSSLLIRTTAVTIVVMGFFGIATGALPVRCWVGGACGTSATPAAGPAAEAASPQPPAAMAAPSSAAPTPDEVAVAETTATTTVAKSAPTLTHNDVLASTFAQLRVDVKTPARTGSSTTAVASAATQPAGSTLVNPETGLSKRVVRPLTVRADGSVELPPVAATAYAEPAKVPAVPASSPAVAAAAQIGAGEKPAAEARPAAESKPAAEKKIAEASPSLSSKPKPAEPAGKSSSGLSIVAGAGANIRATPSKGGKVLFALNGGEKVTVLESKRGWSRIKDDQGRTGWIFDDGLKHG